MVACALGLFASSMASAQDDAVVGRLTRYGKLSAGQAGRLSRGISKQMARSAGMANQPNDPLRVAVSRALFGQTAPADRMGEANVRLRLYAGLNEWALESLFPPRPGVVSSCQRDFGASRGDCEALVAAAGRIALSDAQQLAGGDASAYAGAAPMPGAQTNGFAAQPNRFRQYNSGATAGGYATAGYGQQQPPRFGGGGAAPAYGQQPSRFGGGGAAAAPAYGQQPSRFGGGAAAAPAYGQRPAPGGYAAPAAGGFGQRPAAGGYAAPAATFRPAPAYGAQQPARFGAAPAQPRPLVAPVPVARPVAPVVAVNTKAEYQARRQAYLARQQQEMEARKAKTLAAATGGPGRPKPDAPAAAAPAAAPKAAPAPVAKAAPADPDSAPPDADFTTEAPAEEPAAAAPEPAKKPQLDGDFLDGLLDDPLGKKK